MTTVHATTSTQMTTDGPSRKNLRGGQCTTTLSHLRQIAAKAVGKVILD
jgi:glyceraldehyde 3-phosphate dehydrogenase